MESKNLRVQNAAAWLVLTLGPHDHISQGLRELHWLPIRVRVLYKLCVLMYDVHSSRSPAYIKDTVTARCSSSQRPGLRSASTTDYIKPRLSTEFGERAFSYAGPHAWNDLRVELRSQRGNFKKNSWRLTFLILFLSSYVLVNCFGYFWYLYCTMAWFYLYIRALQVCHDDADDHTHRVFFLPRAKDELPPSSPSRPVFSLPIPQKHGPLNPARGSGECCKLSQWGQGRSPSRQTIWCILESECSSGGSSFYWFSREQMCKFMSEIQFLIAIGRRPMRSYFSWGTCHHCPMEVGAYDDDDDVFTWVCDVDDLQTSITRPSTGRRRRVSLGAWNESTGRRRTRWLNDWLNITATLPAFAPSTSTCSKTSTPTNQRQTSSLKVNSALNLCRLVNPINQSINPGFLKWPK